MLLLDGRNAVTYGGGGATGGAVARAFVREGARVHLAGRTLASLERVAEQVRAAGGVAETAVVDALDEGLWTSTPTRWRPAPAGSTSAST
jgi:3-oxoacyl-[acyl-carrier protein] reductase